jgi:hypothetical protein
MSRRLRRFPFSGLLCGQALRLKFHNHDPATQVVTAPCLPGFWRRARRSKVAGDFIFTEGRPSDKDGNVYFVDQDNNRIMSMTWPAS